LFPLAQGTRKSKRGCMTNPTAGGWSAAHLSSFAFSTSVASPVSRLLSPSFILPAPGFPLPCHTPKPRYDATQRETQYGNRKIQHITALNLTEFRLAFQWKPSENSKPPSVVHSAQKQTCLTHPSTLTCGGVLAGLGAVNGQVASPRQHDPHHDRRVGV
jgi:hypothetical protein